MANKVFQGLAKEKIEIFKRVFAESKQLFWDETKSELIHPGEFGTYREAIVKDFINIFIPSRYSIGSGFILNTNGKISTQCDLVIYDHQSTPLMQSINHQEFYPIETVVAIGEIKSDIQSKSDLTKSLVKLAKIKEMREGIGTSLILKREKEGNYDPIRYPFDQLFTFLICNKFGFEVTLNSYQNYGFYPDDISIRHKHNILFSIYDGIYIYHNGECNYYYPMTGEKVESEKLISPDNKEIDSHFLHLITGLVKGIKLSTILSPDMSMYLSDNLFLGK